MLTVTRSRCWTFLKTEFITLSKKIEEEDNRKLRLEFMETIDIHQEGEGLAETRETGLCKVWRQMETENPLAITPDATIAIGPGLQTTQGRLQPSTVKRRKRTITTAR